MTLRKPTVADKIPPKLVKLAADFLSNPPSDSVDISLPCGIFPEAAKIAASNISNWQRNRQQEYSY